MAVEQSWLALNAAPECQPLNVNPSIASLTHLPIMIQPPGISFCSTLSIATTYRHGRGGRHAVAIGGLVFFAVYF